MMQLDLSTVSFKDTVFLQLFGLNQVNVLDYFAQSQFYDHSCTNEQLKMQARFNELEAHLLDITKMVGIEFTVWYFTLQPSYFVIRKSYRFSPTNTQLLMIYYIIDGTIFQAPLLSSLLETRMKTALYYITEAYEKLTDSVTFNPIDGLDWNKIQDETLDEIKMEKTDNLQKYEMDLNNNLFHAIKSQFWVPEAKAEVEIEKKDIKEPEPEKIAAPIEPEKKLNLARTQSISYVGGLSNGKKKKKKLAT